MEVEREPERKRKERQEGQRKISEEERDIEEDRKKDKERTGIASMYAKGQDYERGDSLVWSRVQ